MTDDIIDFNLPVNEHPILTVIGIGGGGNNAVDRMCQEGIREVDFMNANTDAQSLQMSPVAQKVQLGRTLTEGRGAGSRSDIGEQAAIESITEITDFLGQNTRMAFLVAGMGGGTGTGAAPVIARACREMGILTVGVVTLPFRFEGPKRLRLAISGIHRLKEEVDALLIIHNEKLREIYGNKPISVAFANADEILTLAVKGIAEIITIHGYINVDFADVVSVMKEGGIAFMGSATASGSDRARKVIDETINSPLLNNNDIKGASRVLLNITSGRDEITVDEIGVITDFITEKVGGRVNTIWGTCTDEALEESIRVTLVATGFKDDAIPEWITVNPPERKVIPLTDSPAAPPIPPKVKAEPESLQEIESKPEPDPEPEPHAKVVDLPVDLPEDITETPYVPPEPPKAEDPKAELLRAYDYRNLSDPKKIDEAERVPAFKRRKGSPQRAIFEETEQESRFTLGRDAKLRPNNSYLHDAVD
ncbi:MAG: cell division protein FtsZ [Bacteroidales bacterium]|nr:cell division protein FtsZ [Bacteroidales bacterium]